MQEIQHKTLHEKIDPINFTEFKKRFLILVFIGSILVPVPGIFVMTFFQFWSLQESLAVFYPGFGLIVFVSAEILMFWTILRWFKKIFLEMEQGQKQDIQSLEKNLKRFSPMFFLFWALFAAIGLVFGNSSVFMAAEKNNVLPWLNSSFLYIVQVFLIILPLYYYLQNLLGSFFFPGGIEGKAGEKSSRFDFLLKERNFVDAIIHKANVIFVVLDNQGRIVLFNDEAEKVTGYDSEFIIGKYVWDYFILPEEIEIIRNVFSSLRNDLRSSQFENYWLKKSGEKIKIQWSNSVLADSRGSVSHVVSVGIDVTEQRETEAELLRSKETLASAQEIAHIGSWDWNILTGDLKWSDEIFRIFGQDVQAFPATYDAFLETIHPEDRNSVIEAVNEAVADVKKEYSVNHRVVRPDGEIRFVQEHGKVYRNEAGEPVRMIGTVHDISQLKKEEDARKKSEAQLRIIMRNLPIELWVIDQYGSLMLSEGKSNTLFGDMLKNSAGKKYQDVFKNFPELLADISKSKEGKELSSFRKIGKETYQIFYSPIRGKDEIMEEGVVAVAMDISELRKIQDELHMHQDKLEDLIIERTSELEKEKMRAEQASNAKTEFLSRMSHELRTPMNAILGFSQFLNSDKTHTLHPEHQELLDEILLAANHLMTLINEILDLSRIENGKIEYEKESINAFESMEEALNIIRGQKHRNTVEIHNQINPVNCLVYADRIRLRQIFLNLLSNAIKFNKPEGKITVSCRLLSDNSRIRIAVKDTGIGIPEDKFNLLFKPFERLGVEKLAIDGTGIGLSLCKKLSEEMNGSLFFESKVTEGSTFFLELPAAESENRGRDNTMTEADEVSKKILYIEDNASNIRVINTFFKRKPHYRLFTAMEPALGLELAETQMPDLIMLDINLPGMDGYEVYRILQENPVTKKIPVIAITANAMHDDVEKGRAAGFTDYLTKPVDMDHLFGVIDRVFEKK